MNMQYAKPTFVSASAIQKARVVDAAGEDLGKIEEIVIDLASGRVAYAALSFGGFLGLGNKLFAIPLEALQVHPAGDKIVLDVDREMLENAPGFDKDHWPSTSEDAWLLDVYGYYGYPPYWE